MSHKFANVVCGVKICVMFKTMSVCVLKANKTNRWKIIFNNSHTTTKNRAPPLVADKNTVETVLPLYYIIYISQLIIRSYDFLFIHSAGTVKMKWNTDKIKIEDESLRSRKISGGCWELVKYLREKVSIN